MPFQNPRITPFWEKSNWIRKRERDKEKTLPTLGPPSTPAEIFRSTSPTFMVEDKQNLVKIEIS
jgi:hypothetical protein